MTDIKDGKQRLLKRRIFSKILAFSYVFKVVIYFILFYIFFCCKIMSVFSPCFYGLMLSLLFLGENAFVIIIPYFFAIAINTNNSILLFICVIMSVAASIIQTIYNHHNKTISLYMSIVYGIALSFPYLLFKILTLREIYVSIVNIVFNILFMLCNIIFINLLKKRHFNLNLNIDEMIYGFFIWALFFCGLSNINIFPFDIVKFFGITSILFFGNILPSSFSVIVSVVCGLGSFLCNGNLAYITFFSTLSVFCSIFNKQNRFFEVVTVFIVDFCFSYFLHIFGQSSFYLVLPSMTSCFLYLMCPKKLFIELKNKLFIYKGGESLKNILNQNKLLLSKKLLYTSEVFYEMDKNFRKLILPNLDTKEVKKMMCDEIVREHCENCPNRANCLKGSNNEISNIFLDCINTGFEKGEVSLIDLPPYLSTRCIKLNQILISINNIIDSYKNISISNSQKDSSKLLVAEQLKGISNVLDNLSREANRTINIDGRFDEKIKNSLVYNDIIPSEIVCFEEGEKVNIVSMVIRSIDFDNEKIVQILNSIFPNKMKLDTFLKTKSKGLTYLSYKTAPTYDMALGIGRTTKGGSSDSGDTYSFIKLNNGKLILTLCDGMGSGKKAKEKSENSISLIENFYRAGYDSQTVLSSVNSLTNLTSENVFSAVDISVVDLKSGETHFIKQGATVGFIKKGESVSKIESNSLPLGILKEVSPHITKTILSTNDFIIMTSDGIVDAFGEDNFMNYLKYLPCQSPQCLADTVLSKAKILQQNYTADDMTIIVGKLFYNNI